MKNRRPAFADQIPRDATVLVQRTEDRNAAFGRRCVQVDGRLQLSEHWSDISRRFPAVVAIGDNDFQADVENLAHITAANNAGTLGRGRTWVEHVLKSLPILHQHRVATGLQSDAAAFIVGAGPSLDDDREILEKLERHGIVFAVNAGTRACAHHFAVSNESNDQRGKTVVGAGATLMTGPQAHPGLRASHPLAWVLAGELGETLATVTGHPVLPSCASSSTVAFSVAAWAHLSPIVLVGQDLGFPEGDIYAAQAGGFGGRASMVGDQVRYEWSETSRRQPRGTPLPVHEDCVEIPRVGGGSLWSTRPLAAVARWIGREALLRRLRVVQTSRRGAAISGCVHKPLEDVLRELTPKPKPRIHWGERSRIDAERVRRFVEWERAALGEVIRRPCAETVRATTLLDAWAFAPVHAFLDERRQGPVDTLWGEYRRARTDRVKLDRLVRAQAEELRERLRVP